MEVKVTYGVGKDKIGKEYFSTTESGINRAIEYVNSHGGGTVNIGEGTYIIDSINEYGQGVVLDGKVKLKGVFRKTIFTPKVDSHKYKNYLYLIFIKSSPQKIVVEDILFKGCDNKEDRIYGVHGYMDLLGYELRSQLIKNCVFQDIYVGCSLGNSGKSNVINCYFENCFYIPLYISLNSEVTVDGCFFINNTRLELFCIEQPCIIVNNIITNSVEAGIYVKEVKSLQICGNIIQNCAQSGINMDADQVNDFVISGNIIQNCHTGIKAKSNHLVIHSNLLRGNKTMGIYAYKGLECQVRDITGNLADKNKGFDCYFQSAKVCNAFGNTFYSSTFNSIEFDNVADFFKLSITGLMCNRMDETNVSKTTHYVSVNGRLMEGGQNNDRN